MESERWRRVEAMYQAALEHQAPERAAFLEEMCAGDEPMRHEVESLLRRGDASHAFFDAPAAELAPRTQGEEPSLIGVRLASYQITDLLGSGGMGRVYRARDTRLDRLVAIKILDDRFSARFEREARAVAALNHPNVCTLYDIGPNYLVMELVEGESLAAKLRRGPLPTDLVMLYCLQITEALAAAHSKNIVHRDLKPENVLITTDDRVKLVDFGLALIRPAHYASEDVSTFESSFVTRPGSLLGTLAYMSPEQARGERVEATSDVFSLGALMYETATGERAFFRASPAETLAAILKEDPPAIANEPDLDRIIRRCLAKEARQRFQTAIEVGAALRSLRATGTQESLAAIDPPAGRAMEEAARQARSVAVLPFVNLGGAPDLEYFSDGITEALIAELAQIGALRVISRTSVMRYKGSTTPLATIARELNARTIVEGSVLCADPKVRITAQLIDAATDTHLWARTYQRDLRDILALQSEVARNIAESIKVRVTNQEERQLQHDRAVVPEAYHAYLRGRFHWHKRTTAEIKRAIIHFQDAIRYDPAYARAYAGLADCHVVLTNIADVPLADAIDAAKITAEKALELDPELAEAHNSLAFVRWHDWDWDGTERELKTTLELNPNDATAHNWYANYLSAVGRGDEAIAEARRALELDPLSLQWNMGVGRFLYHARRYDEAIAQELATLELDSTFNFAHWVLGLCYVEKGNPGRAIEHLEIARDSSGRAGVFLGTLGWGYSRAGRTNDALAVRGELTRLSHERCISPVCFALVDMGLGDHGRAFEHLAAACRLGQTMLLRDLPVSPMFDSLRSDPGFDDLLRLMRLPSRTR